MINLVGVSFRNSQQMIRPFQTFGLRVMMLKQVTNSGLTNWNLSLTSVLKNVEFGYVKSSIIKKYDL